MLTSFVVSVSATFVYDTDASSRFCFGGQEISDGGGETDRDVVTSPFLPELKVPDALTGPATVFLSWALDSWLPLFTHTYVAVTSAVNASLMSWFGPRPASLKLTVSDPSVFSVPLGRSVGLAEMVGFGLDGRTLGDEPVGEDVDGVPVADDGAGGSAAISRPRVGGRITLGARDELGLSGEGVGACISRTGDGEGA